MLRRAAAWNCHNGDTEGKAMKSKSSSQQPNVYLYHARSEPMVDETSMSFREFDDRIDQALLDLEESMADYQRPVSRSPWHDRG